MTKGGLYFMFCTQFLQRICFSVDVHRRNIKQYIRIRRTSASYQSSTAAVHLHSQLLLSKLAVSLQMNWNCYKRVIHGIESSQLYGHPYPIHVRQRGSNVLTLSFFLWILDHHKSNVNRLMFHVSHLYFTIYPTIRS